MKNQDLRQTSDGLKDTRAKILGVMRGSIADPSTSPALIGARQAMLAGARAIGGPILGRRVGAEIALYPRIRM
jgi:hypothetical protein